MILFDFIKSRIIAQTPGNGNEFFVVRNQVTTNYKLLQVGLGGIMPIHEFDNPEKKHLQLKCLRSYYQVKSLKVSRLRDMVLPSLKKLVIRNADGIEKLGPEFYVHGYSMVPFQSLEKFKIENWKGWRDWNTGFLGDLVEMLKRFLD
ncbi:hypothetical protein Q3G72_021615 [Acer saccharum]|nr:hypothetical protein Q3G72_021615 [Acer saccharum]